MLEGKNDAACFVSPSLEPAAGGAALCAVGMGDIVEAYLMEQILDKADSGEVQLARAANQASRKIQLLHYSLQTAAGVMVALLLLFSIPNLDFTSLHQDTSSQTDRILPEHENGRLYQFTRELGQNIGDGTSSFIKYVSDFSSKLMNGGK